MVYLFWCSDQLRTWGNSYRCSADCGLASVHSVMFGSPSSSNCWWSGINIHLPFPINPHFLGSHSATGLHCILLPTMMMRLTLSGSYRFFSPEQTDWTQWENVIKSKEVLELCESSFLRLTVSQEEDDVLGFVAITLSTHCSVKSLLRFVVPIFGMELVLCEHRQDNSDPPPEVA